MKNLAEIFEARKDEILEKTLELMPLALSGDRANVTFFIEMDNDQLKVDYHYYAGQIILDDSCFFTIKNFEYPDAEEYGYDEISEMDFSACGYDEYINIEIEHKIALLEQKY